MSLFTNNFPSIIDLSEKKLNLTSQMLIRQARNETKIMNKIKDDESGNFPANTVTFHRHLQERHKLPM